MKLRNRKKTKEVARVHIDVICRYSREIRETAGPRKSVCSPDRGNKIKYTSRVGLSSGEVRLFDFDLCRPQYAMQCEVLERKGEKGPTLPARCRLRFQYFFSFFFFICSWETGENNPHLRFSIVS